MKKIKLMVMACTVAVLALSVSGSTAIAQQSPSDLIANSTVVTSPGDNSTVGLKFYITGTYRADLGCDVGQLNAQSVGTTPTSAYFGIGSLSFNSSTGTFSYYVDSTTVNMMGPGTYEFSLDPDVANCGGGGVTLTIAPTGGVATGAGGSN